MKASLEFELFLLFRKTFCSRLDKYNLNQLFTAVPQIP